MNYSELSKKKFYFEDETFKKFTKLSGGMKKKKDEPGFKQLFQNSVIKFCCFHLKGLLFAYYDHRAVTSIYLLA